MEMFSSIFGKEKKNNVEFEPILKNFADKPLGKKIYNFEDIEREEFKVPFFDQLFFTVGQKRCFWCV